MTAIWNRVNTLLLLLVLFALLTVIGMLAAGVRGGPLDPPGAPAETGSVRLPGTPIDAPAEITEPGHYYLTRNITLTQGVGIQITVDDVTLDLGGFTIDGGAAGDDTGVSAGNQSRVHIYNGIIDGAETGVDVAGEDVRVSDIAVYNASTGFRLAAKGALLEDCVASGNKTGVELDGLRGVVRDCLIRSNDGSGIVVNGGANGALIERSAIRENNPTDFVGEAGIRIYINANEATIRDNDLGANGYADVAVGGADTVIIDNALDCPTSIVLDASSSNTFDDVNTTDPHTNRAHRLAC